MVEPTTVAESALRTRASLLAQLGQDPYDNAAWTLFAERYGPRLAAWCRRWGLPEPDVDDVVQAVLVRLAVKMRGFRYDPARSFRAWLKTLARHAWSDYVAGRRRSVPAVGGAAGETALLTVAAGDDLERQMEEAFDLELLDAATRRVRARVAERTWEAFRLTVLEQQPAAEVAAALGMPVMSVFKAKSNVQKMLRAAAAELEAAETNSRAAP